MLPVFWLESADADLAAITEYIGLHNIEAAERMWGRLRNSVLPLSQNPYLYAISERVPGLREIVAHPNYLVVTACNRKPSCSQSAQFQAQINCD
ncbi:type II toxin-antitoxin system RelE/ParE family toxin [Pseudomonas protegens]|uniref:type II toxin-antitoxin system RelE/ParE family toxin n=1 Tax=Pseudomonas protegens TaxID=380021 RepID=UPI000D3C0501|nr:type II toxin-antitoxin system RelE/ParE family toxin [Pseudomonas protegens]